VIELRFHRELYAGNAIDEALKTFARFAKFEQAEEPTHWIVRLTTGDPDRERRITIKSGGVTGATV
jgi:hypothetical protein